MVQDTVDLVPLDHLVQVPLLQVFAATDEDAAVSPGHAAERVRRIEVVEDPAVAVSRCGDARLQFEELRGKIPQFAPDWHAFPINTELLVSDGSDAVGNALFQFVHEQPVVINRFLSAAQNDGWSHLHRLVEESDRRGMAGRGLEHLFPEFGALTRQANDLAQLVDVQLGPGDSFQRLNQRLRLSRQVVDHWFGQLANGTGRVDSDTRDVPLARVELEPVLHVAALVRVEDQHVRLGRARQFHFVKRTFTFQVRADVARQVRTDVGREAFGVGQRDQIARHPASPQHGAVVLGEVDVEAHRMEEFRGANARAPSRLLSLFGALRQFREILAHQGLHLAGGFEVFAISSHYLDPFLVQLPVEGDSVFLVRKDNAVRRPPEVWEAR